VCRHLATLTFALTRPRLYWYNGQHHLHAQIIILLAGNDSVPTLYRVLCGCVVYRNHVDVDSVNDLLIVGISWRRLSRSGDHAVVPSGPVHYSAVTSSLYTRCINNSPRDTARHHTGGFISLVSSHLTSFHLKRVRCVATPWPRPIRTK